MCVMAAETLNEACVGLSMHAFDAPMHGKQMNLREFSSKYDHDHDAQPEAGADDRGGSRRRNLLWRLFPACSASAMTSVYALRREATDWGPEAALLHFFLATFLPLRVYARLCSPDRTRAVWPGLALHASVMLFAYPYDTAAVSGVVFCAVLLCDGFYVGRSAGVRSLAANALTLLVLSNAVLCLIVYSRDSRLAASYYHASFASLCVLLVSF